MALTQSTLPACLPDCSAAGLDFNVALRFSSCTATILSSGGRFGRLGLLKQSSGATNHPRQPLVFRNSKSSSASVDPNKGVLPSPLDLPSSVLQLSDIWRSSEQLSDEEFLRVLEETKQHRLGKKEVIVVEKEMVIKTNREQLVTGLAKSIEDVEERRQFELFCERCDAVVRAWYHHPFEEMLELYNLFDPNGGTRQLQRLGLTVEQVEEKEIRFLELFFRVMDKSNFRLLTDEEFEVATSTQYLLDLPIAVDSKKLDNNLLRKFLDQHPMDRVPEFGGEYLIFRRGIGVDRVRDFFFREKIDLLIERAWDWLLQKLNLKDPPLEEYIPPPPKNQKPGDEMLLKIERLRLKNLELTPRNILSKNTIQEPTFDRMVLIYRPATPKNFSSELGLRSICLQHFCNIPMADVIIVLPEKKNPSLTPLDWTKLTITALGGLTALTSSVTFDGLHSNVAVAAMIGFSVYFARIFFALRSSIARYQSLITVSMYNRHLDCNKGTLLHLFDNVLQQEIKEIVVAYYMLMREGAFDELALDRRCESLMLEMFREELDFDVEDAVDKLLRLSVVQKDENGIISCVPLRRANEIIGVTTEERIEEMATATLS